MPDIVLSSEDTKNENPCPLRTFTCDGKIYVRRQTRKGREGIGGEGAAVSGGMAWDDLLEKVTLGRGVEEVKG